MKIVSTIICGDNYFGENLDAATDTIIEMVKKCEPDVFVAGPAFNAGRYGVACGTICKAVEERLGIPGYHRYVYRESGRGYVPQGPYHCGYT